MTPQQQEMLEQQRISWDKYSRGWQEWDELVMGIMQPIGERMIADLPLRGDEQILDVASGTGEPGLSVSKVVPQGKVVATDLSEKMVSIANENARQRGITNYQSQVADASNLPFPDHLFNHVICRFGLMFFPDMEAGLREMHRVLKPGGRVSLAVWALPEKNPFFTVMAGTVREKLELPPPPPDAPGIFRCSPAGTTEQLLSKVGFEKPGESPLPGEAVFDSPEQYWDFFSSVAGPIMEALKDQPPSKIEEVRTAVVKRGAEFVRNGRMYTPWKAITATGIKG